MTTDFPDQHLRTLIDEDTTSKWLGVHATDLAPGRATVELTVAEHMCNGLGTCHGGIIFTLADIAFSYACNSAGALNVAAQADIQFVAPARIGDTLQAVAIRRFRFGKDDRRGIYDVTVSHAGSGDLVAIFTGTAAQVSPPAGGRPA